MTRRDYVRISSILRGVRDSYAPHWDPNLFRACDDHARAVALEFSKCNPKGFDAPRFLADAGVPTT